MAVGDVASRTVLPANTATTSSGRKPRLERIYVSFDGSIKAVYEDNTLLVLSAEGQTFTHVSPAGVKTVQLCEFCLSRFAPLLAELLDFRNQHVDVPALCKPFKQQLAKHGQLFQLGYPIADICWPATPEQAFQQQLVELPDKQRIAVLSKCSSARIILEYTGLRFAVCYPLLIDHDTARNTYTYTWQTQVFSRSQYPARWRPALAVASAVADNAAAGFRIQQQLHHQQQQLLADVSNRPSSCRSSCSSPMRLSSPCRNSSSSPVKRYGSPLQRQHKGWQQQQQQQQQQQLYEFPRAVGSPVRCSMSPTTRLGSPRRNFGSATKQQQQQQQQQQEDPQQQQIPHLQDTWQQQHFLDQQQCSQQIEPDAAINGPSSSSSSSTTCTTQLPISDELLHALPTYQQQLRQQQQQQQQQHSGSSSSSKYAAALAQALGQRKHPAAAAAAAAGGGGELGRGWWLEPSLLLPSDELLQMVWSREATMLFVKDIAEVEVWIHADDSCLYSFQSGAFVTHLLPSAAAAAWDSTAAGNLRRSMEAVTSHPPPPPPAAAAAAAAAVHPVLNGWHSRGRGGILDHDRSTLDLQQQQQQQQQWQQQQQQCDVTGLVDGVVDAADMSRVYAATALPEMPVVAAAAAAAAADNGTTAAAAASGGWGMTVKVHVGRIAAAALKFRSTMTRIQQCVNSTAAAAAASSSSPLLPTSSIYHLQQQQQQQQQQVFSTDVIEQQDVSGVGGFTAYGDGRVRVLFADRTILNLTADQVAASLVMPDGSCRTVPAAKPLGVEPYVQCALEFAAWSSTSPEERAAALRLQALVAAELRSSARMAAICDWGSSHRLPPPAAAAAAAEHESAANMQAIEWSAAAAAEEEEVLGYGDHSSAGVRQQDSGMFGYDNYLDPAAAAAAAGSTAFEDSSRTAAGGSCDQQIMHHSSWYQLPAAAAAAAPVGEGKCSAGESLSGPFGAAASGGGATGSVGICSSDMPPDALDRQLAVEQMLQANARLLQRLQV